MYLGRIKPPLAKCGAKVAFFAERGKERFWCGSYFNIIYARFRVCAALSLILLHPKGLMRVFKRILGLPLIVFGAAIIVVCFFFDCGHANLINVFGTVMIAAGIGSYMWVKKSESKY